MLDGATLRQRRREGEQPDLIVPEIEAIATDVLVALEGEGFHVVPSASAARLTMNREGIRQLAATETLGLPTSPFRFVEDLTALQLAAQELGWPCVIKPLMSSSGKGQSVMKSAADVPSAWAYAQSGSRSGAGRCIVEGWVPFDYEITVLTVSAVNGMQCCPADRPPPDRRRLSRVVAAHCHARQRLGSRPSVRPRLWSPVLVDLAFLASALFVVSQGVTARFGSRDLQ